MCSFLCDPINPIPHSRAQEVENQIVNVAGAYGEENLQNFHAAHGDADREKRQEKAAEL